MYDQYANQAQGLSTYNQLATPGHVIQPPTIRENIDRQIESHQAAIARLEATKASLEKANFLDMKINDLAEAMRF